MKTRPRAHFRALYLVLAFASCPRGAMAQDDGERASFFRLAIAPAWALPSGFVRGENRAGEPVGWSPAIRAEVGWQTDGAEAWQRAYNYPALGAGFYVADYGEGLGAPMAAYVFYSWPFFDRGDRLALTTDWALGMAWNFEPFDPVENPSNNLVGSKATFYLDMGLYLRYRLTQVLDLYAGAAFTHFSTGQIHEPNKGLHTLSPVVSLRYDFGKPTRSRNVDPLPPFERRLDRVLAFAVGSKEIDVATTSPELAETDRRRRFFIWNVGAALSWHVYRKGKIAGGLDLTYDGSVGTTLEDTGPVGEKLGVGLYGGYEHALGPADILVHVGAYVWQTWDDQKPRLYQRLGFRYFITDGFYAGINLRVTDWGRADFIELNAGFRFR